LETRRSALTLSLVLACLVLLAGGGTAATLDAPITVTSGGLCICHAPLYVGIAKGIFAKDGVNLRVLRVASGFEGLAALQTGSAQVADAVPAVAAQAIAQGIDVKAVLPANGDATGTVPTDNYFAVIARPGRGIRSDHLEDLKGKTIGLPVGTVAHQYLFYAAQAKNLDPQKDFRLQNVSPADLPSALQSGSVDAIVSWEPIPLQALSMMKDAVVVARGGNHIQYLFFRWMSSRYVATNPGTTKRFVAAFAESAQYTREHPDEAADIVAKEFNGLDRGVIRQSLRYLTFDMRVSRATMDAAQQGLDFASKIGALKQTPSLNSMLDLRYLNQVVKEDPKIFSDLPAIPRALVLP